MWALVGAVLRLTWFISLRLLICQSIPMAKGLLVWLMDGCACVREGLVYMIMRFNGLSYANSLFNCTFLPGLSKKLFKI